MSTIYYCKNCSFEFEEPEKIYEAHNFADTPFEIVYICPRCKSSNFREKNTTHCRCCGARLLKGRVEYCSDSCKRKGERLWEKELKSKRAKLSNGLAVKVRECLEYNRKSGTKYSYGQYVAIIEPKLLKEKKLCANKKRST